MGALSYADDIILSCHSIRRLNRMIKICSFFANSNHIIRIGIHVLHLPLCKLYKCFDLYLLNHHNTIASGVFILDLCLLRENNIVDDDQDLTSTELTYMIDRLCTS